MKYIGSALWLFSGVCLTLAPEISAAQTIESDVDNVGSTSFFGGVGLIEMRNARFAPDGELSVGAGYSTDGQNYYAVWQATPWLETTLRFSDYDDGLRGIDKAIDLKLRLTDEGEYRPAIAIGLQDLLGDGTFSGEYIVASKKIHDFDVTMGFGFGSLAQRSQLYNVNRIFGKSFEQRNFDDPGSEKIRFSDYFSGEKMGFFWGVEYNTPVKGLTTKVEYSTLDKSKIPLFSDYESKTAFNFGANYKIKNWLEVGGGLHHGNQVSFHITLKQNLHKPTRLRMASGPEMDSIRIRELRDVARHSNDYKDASDQDIIFERMDALGYAVTSFELADEGIKLSVRRNERPASSDQAVLGGLLENYERATVAFENREITMDRGDPEAREAKDAFRGSATFARENLSGDDVAINNAIISRMSERKLRPHAVAMQSGDLMVEKAAAPFIDLPKNIGRTVRILTSEAPDNVERFRIVSKERGVAVSDVSVLRKDFEKLADYNSSPEEIFANARINEPGVRSDQNVVPGSFPHFEYGILPDLESHFGSEKDDHFKGDFNLRIFGRVDVSEKLQIYAEAKQHIIGNLDQIPASTNPDVPHVRSDVGRYAAEGTTSIRRLTLEHIENPIRNIYTRLTAGHLEAMYSGVSGEVLYRPYGGSFALGLDANFVKQRDFDQLFSMRDYETVTGHLSAYYVNKKYDLTTKVSVGRYLAKDWGTSIELYRQFKNGIRIGAKATFTDMSEGDFGRGSFDKQVYMTIPFDFLWFRQSREKAEFRFRRLGKDGGQKLDHHTDLFDLLSDGQPYRLENNWHQILE